jgi:hypothetical protein
MQLFDHDAFSGRRHNMKMFTMFAIAFLAFAVSPASSQPNDPSSTNDNQQTAVTLVRAVNTAEQLVKSKTGHFSDKDEILASPEMQNAAKRLHFSQPLNAVPEGYALRLVVSKDSSSYQLSLEEKGDCGTSFFSDERGLIYTGLPIGCSR